MEKIKYTRERKREKEIDEGESETKLRIRQVSVYDTVKPSFLPLPDYFSPEYQCVIPWRPFVSTGPDPTQAGKTKRTRTSNRLGWLTTRARASASVRNKRYALSLPRWCVPHAKVDKNSWHLRSEGHASTANFHAARRSAASRRASRSVSMGTAPVTIPSRLHELSRGLPVLIVSQ